MSETHEDVPQEEVLVEETIFTVSIEDKAREMGWKPKDEFKGDESEWKGAAAFVKDAELFASLKAQNAQINELKQALQEVKGFLTKSEQAGYQRAIEELKEKQKDAVNRFDAEELEKVNNARLELERKLLEQSVKPQVPQKNQAELDFEARNAFWYNDNTPDNSLMKKEAIMLSATIAQTQPTLTPEQHVALLESKIKALHPDKFKNVRRSEPSPVAVSSKATAKVDDLAGIDPEILASAKRQVKVGVFKSVEEAIKEMKKFGVI